MCLIASKHWATFARLYPMNLLTWLTAQATGLGMENGTYPNHKGSVNIDVGPNGDLTEAL